MKYKYPLLNVDTPSKEEVAKTTPNPAHRELIQRLGALGQEIALDRYEAQQPQCLFGLRGICCQRCLWGPCRIFPGDPKRSRGICGADLGTIVVGNLLRSLAAGCAAHAQHALEVQQQLLRATEPGSTIPLRGEATVWELARRFGIATNGRTVREVAREVGEILLADLTRHEDTPLRTLLAFAPRERIELWKRLGILPRSAYHEIVEALHKTSLGGDSDWRDLALHELRTALAYGWSTLFGSSLATEILYGLPQPAEVEVGFGSLRLENVNVVTHGHSPVLAEEIVALARTEEFQAKARAAGAQRLEILGLCCTGHELLARHGVPTLGNLLGQELVIGTGAVDLFIADMQCVLPGVKAIADCFGTRVVTTSQANRIPGAVHLPWDPARGRQLAREALELAIEAYQTRPRPSAAPPASKARAKVGYSYEEVLRAFGGIHGLLDLLRTGKIRGLATVVGCNNPKVPYEASHVAVARALIEGNVLVTTSGCAGHALLAAGLSSPAAAQLAGPSLRKVLEERGLPPVLPIGACVDNTRTVRLFIDLAEAAGLPLHEMPFVYSGPEPGNEKTLGQGLNFLTLGVSVHTGFPAGVPVPIPQPLPGATRPDEYDRGGNPVVDFFADEAEALLGARLYTEPYPQLAAKLLLMHIRRKRLALASRPGWEVPPAIPEPLAAADPRTGTGEGV